MKTKSKLLIIFLALTVLIFIIMFSVFRNKNISQIYKYSPNEFTKIYVTDGNTGNVKEITSKEDIDKIQKYISNIKLKKQIASSSTGWSYSLSFCNKNDEEKLKVIFNGDDFCTIKSNKYKITRSDNVSIMDICNGFFGK